MYKTLTAIAVAAMIGFTAVAIPDQAEARWRGWWVPGAIVGGLALGAIASGAYRPYYYAPGPYYGYYGPDYYYGHPPYVYEGPPVYVAPRSSYSGYTYGGYYYGPQDCWPCY